MELGFVSEAKFDAVDQAKIVRSYVATGRSRR
jgi:hypothetical protein